jgi:hypothetical protein
MKFTVEWYDADGNQVVYLTGVTSPSLADVWDGMQPGDSLTVTRTDDVS